MPKPSRRARERFLGRYQLNRPAKSLHEKRIPCEHEFNISKIRGLWAADRHLITPFNPNMLRDRMGTIRYEKNGKELAQIQYSVSHGNHGRIVVVSQMGGNPDFISRIMGEIIIRAKDNRFDHITVSVDPAERETCKIFEDLHFRKQPDSRGHERGEEMYIYSLYMNHVTG